MTNTKEIIISLILMLCFATQAFATGLLGKKYVTLGMDGIFYDIDIENDMKMQYMMGVNLPMNENIDLFGSLKILKTDILYNIPISEIVYSANPGEIEATQEFIRYLISGGVNYHFYPEKTIDPFISLSVGINKIDNNEIAIKGNNNTSIYKREFMRNNEVFYEIGLGAEYKINRLSMVPGFSYGRNADIGEKDDFFLSGLINCSMTDTVLLWTGCKYATSEKDIIVNWGVKYKF